MVGQDNEKGMTNQYSDEGMSNQESEEGGNYLFYSPKFYFNCFLSTLPLSLLLVLLHIIIFGIVVVMMMIIISSSVAQWLSICYCSYY